MCWEKIKKQIASLRVSYGLRWRMMESKPPAFGQSREIVLRVRNEGQSPQAAGEFVGSQKRFADLLLTRGLEKWRNGMGLRGFQGIGLKAPPTPAYTPYSDN